MERRWAEVQVEVAESEEVRGGGAEERRREAGEEERVGETMPWPVGIIFDVSDQFTAPVDPAHSGYVSGKLSVRTAAHEEVQGSTSSLRLIPFFLGTTSLCLTTSSISVRHQTWCLLCVRYIGTRSRHIPSSSTTQRRDPEKLECSEGLALRCVVGHLTNHIDTNDDAYREEEPSISSFARRTNAHRPALNRAAREASEAWLD